MTSTSCPVYEVLYSKKGAILSFSCEDLAGHPGDVVSVGWIKDGWVVEFEKNNARHAVKFPGVSPEVMERVALHETLLVVGLSKGEDESNPHISLSKEVALPSRD